MRDLGPGSALGALCSFTFPGLTHQGLSSPEDPALKLRWEGRGGIVQEHGHGVSEGFGQRKEWQRVGVEV